MEVGLGQGPRYHSIGEGRSWGVWRLQTQERWTCLQRSQGWGFLTSVRAGHKVISDIPRISGIHFSRDGVEAQEFVTPEAVVAVEPSYGRGAVPNGWPGTFLYGFCREVPEPRVVAFVQSTNKHSVRPFGGRCSRTSGWIPEARSRICVCRASFLMTFVQSGRPPRLPAHDQCMLSHDELPNE